jgi:hypothetical protein
MRLPQELATIILHAARPSTWARDVLHFAPDQKEAEFLDSDALDLLLVWSRQCGKSEAGAALIAHHATFNDGSLILITSATLRQSIIVQSRVQAHLRIATGQPAEWQRGPEYEYEEEDIEGNVQIVRSSVMSLALSNGSEVVSIPPSPDSARGYSPHMILIDESARTRPSLWHAISPMRAARRVRLIAMTTAAAMSGWFYDLWKGDPDVQKSEYLAKDCPRITAEFLAKERRRLPAHVYAAEYENIWYPVAGRLFTPEMIESMFVDDVAPLFPPRLTTEEYRW